MSKILAFCNQKGGVAKTTTVINTASILAEENKRVLVVDFDPQGSCTTALGVYDADDYEHTISSALLNVMNGTTMEQDYGILHHAAGFDLVPANYEFASIEMRMIGATCREKILTTYLSGIEDNYDYILIDCNPSLGLLTLNALAAADEVIIPIEPKPMSEKPLGSTLDTVSAVKRMLNPNLNVAGVLFTKVDRYSTSLNTRAGIRAFCEEVGLNVFDAEIPASTEVSKEAVASKQRYTLCQREPRHKAAQAYGRFVKEVTGVEWSRLSIPRIQAQERC